MRTYSLPYKIKLYLYRKGSMSLPTELILTLSGVSLITSITLFAHLIRRMKAIEARVAHNEEVQRPVAVVIPQERQQQYLPYGYPISPTAPPLQVSI
jgi:hypothetical protein